jgi:acetyltransferase-like isoleucine patch superfamily enzyme
MEIFHKLPLEDVNEEDAVVIELRYDSGAHVLKGDLIYSFETTKAAVDVEADAGGYIFYVVEECQKVKTGSIVCVISSNKDFDIRSIEGSDTLKDSIEITDYRLTKKAKDLADKYNLHLEELNLSGIVREQDLLNIINKKTAKLTEEPSLIIKLDTANPFIERLLNDKRLRVLSSTEKIKLYRENGHSIGENVEIKSGAILIGNSIEVGDNVTIGENTYIEVPEIKIFENTKIGSDGNIVASRLEIGSYNYVGNKVKVDISGGRYPDSNLKTGRGCLVADEAYINVCRQVELGEHVALSPRSMIFTHSYWQSVLDGYSATFGPVRFEDGSWLGAMSQVLPNIIVGSGSIILSGSVISANVKKKTMVGGVPAKLIKKHVGISPSENACFMELKNIVEGFVDYLASDGFEVKRISQEEIDIDIGSEIRKVRVIGPKSETKHTDNDIVITLRHNALLYKTSNNVFDISQKSVNGSISLLEECLINFFRRRGIMFYPTESK